MIIVVVVVVVLTLTRIIKSVVTGQAPVTLELRNTLGKKHEQTKGGTRIYHSWRNSCLHQKHMKEREIGSQPTMCQVHTGAYVSLLAPEKNNYTACHPRKTTTRILHVVPITTHTHDRRKSTHDRRKSIGKKKQKKEKKIKERKEKARKRKNKKGKEKKKRQEKTRQNKQEKTRQEEEARKGKEKKNGHTSRP